MNFRFFLLLVFLNSACEKEKLKDPTPTAIPPYAGTIFLEADIITDKDPTSFQTLTPDGQGSRLMYDRRGEKWITVDAYLFHVTYDDGLTIEVQVNPEFGSTSLAQVEAEKYAIVIGRLPTSLRQDVQTVWIHKGVNFFGGGNNNILIHIGQAALYENDGILEETLVHEASHTSLDATHANAAGWIDAQQKDPTFISTYARDNPTREDIAETFLVYLAVKYRSDRISSLYKEKVEKAIPNRIKYLENQTWNLYPLQ